MNKSKTDLSPFNSEEILRWLLYLITFAWWIKLGVITSTDSISYDNMWAMRPMGYPVFIKFTSLFGLIQSHLPTLFIALLIQLLSIHKLVDFLKKHFDIKKPIVVLITAIFLLPNFTCLIANIDMSECLCYPLYLIVIHLLLKSFFEKSERTATLYLLTVVLLVLVRAQFLFFHLVSFFLILYLFGLLQS